MASSLTPQQDAAYWPVPLARAIVAGLLAAVITFSSDHSARVGLTAFGVYALVSAIVLLVLSLRRMAPGVPRLVFLVQAAVSAVAGITALAGVRSGLPLLLVLLSTWAAITGFLELYLGLRSRRRLASSRDWIFVGALTALLALVTVVMPPGYVQHYVGPNHVRGTLTTAIVVVGMLGAYSAIVAVYLAISALSLKWGPSVVPQDGTSA